VAATLHPARFNEPCQSVAQHAAPFPRTLVQHCRDSFILLLLLLHFFFFISFLRLFLQLKTTTTTTAAAAAATTEIELLWGGEERLTWHGVGVQ